MLDLPPGKYFVSHSYWDRVLLPGYTRPRKSTEVFAPDGTQVKFEDAIDRGSDPISLLQKQLPEDASLFLFPAIEASPLQFVSNVLIEAILTCDGLIYFDGGASAKSFWVAFERDYALRAGKPVFSFIPSEFDVYRREIPPLDLSVHASYSRQDYDQVRFILDFLKNERFFDMWRERKTIGTPNWEQEHRTEIQYSLARGGYMVLFWSEAASKSVWVTRDFDDGLQQQRLIIAGLDNTPGLRLLYPYAQQHFVPLVDENGLNYNRVDDLIVRLYWLIFRNQFPELVYE